ncbi:MAG: YgiQ family radical SAM protein [Oscillospiraceae bacterium]|nr:YgiQ family radical SAM protein [Oscillospiraceae bacterium]
MFLPVAKSDMDARGWDAPDFLLISGDAYVDHPSFGHSVISRVLEAEGFRVAVLAQPGWSDPKSFLALGAPKLGVLVTSGVVDSMVNHYTAAKKRRSQDAYSPGGAAGRRPDRALITYCNRLRAVLREQPLIIGGVEAGLRVFGHYDYWDDYVRRSVLIDTGADLLVYGMGEAAITEIAHRLAGGEPVRSIKDVRGTAYVDTEAGLRERQEAAASAIASAGAFFRPDGGRLRFIELPDYASVVRSKKAYAQAVAAEHGEQDPVRGNALYQRHGAQIVVKNPPSALLAQAQLDRIYELPYERAWHPMYDAVGGVPALEEVKFSVVSHRGCFGGCSFCAVNLHQGRIVQKRSIRSIIGEVELLARNKDFKGYIHDVGGPSANMRNPACAKQARSGACKGRRCMHPRPCKNLVADHRDYLNLLRAVRRVPGVKKVFVRSGVRFDYIMLDKNREFLRELCEHHVSGQLKVAPEHVSKNVLSLMGKPGIAVYDAFGAEFLKTNMALGKKQYLVPYLISGHPGSLLKDAVELAEYLCAKRISPEQVQDFYPTPGTLSTCMYYTGMDPLTMQRVHVPSGEEKIMQRALLQFRKPENRDYVRKALHLTGRADLIGYTKGCLAPPGSPRQPHDKPYGKPHSKPHGKAGPEAAKTKRRYKR